MLFGLANLFLGQVREAEEEANRIYEPVIGIVTAIDDPLAICRVRVKFPSLSSSDDSWWATVVMPGAGNDRGWFTLPEIDDEVLVVFEHGDIARPVVIGAMWNGKDKAVDKNDGANERRVIVSKSGSKIILDDKKKEITISDGGGIGSIKMAESGVVFTASQGDVSIQAKSDLSICAGEIQITGKGNVDLCGKSVGVNATGTTGVKITGNIVALKGSTIDVNPGGVASAAKADGTVSGDGEDSGASGGSSGGAGGASGGGAGGGGASGGGAAGGGGAGGGGASNGAGGAGGGGAGDTPATKNQPVEKKPPLDQHQIEVAVVNALDQPAIGVYYEIDLPDGAHRSGTTDGAGMIRITDIEKPGNCTLRFPDVDKQQPPDEQPPPPPGSDGAVDHNAA